MEPTQELGEELGVVFEQLHWLIRISGHLVADEGEGEVPSIPDSISFLSSRSDPSQGEDPVVSLTSALVI
ncbi:hypothetical protein T484DRAFT_1815595 [Baffinella frigidus]|nr:hypothetical protein T484DRAFT_1815595 [Cryptophyta sp. CCMP2293]